MRRNIHRESSLLSRKIALAGLATLCALGAAPADAALYQLHTVDLGSGFSLSGSITTDGTIGSLATNNVTNWSINVTSVSDTYFTPANTTNLSANVGISGNQLIVPTSPDGLADGGILGFASALHPNRLGVWVADFTGFNVNGGSAAYAYAGGAASGVQPLGQPNASGYVTGILGAGSTYNLKTIDFGNGITLSGTVTASNVGGSAAISDWNVLVRETLNWSFSKSNSSVLSLAGLFSDGTSLGLIPFDQDGNPNGFTIGFGTLDPTEVILADFANDPNGQVGLVTPLLYQTTSPLTLDANGNYIVATAIPEPGPLGLLLSGLCLSALLGGRKSTAGARSGDQA